MSTTTFRGAARLGRPGGTVSPGSLLGALRALIARQEARRALARMDDHLLADIGIDRAQALAEASKPFWTR